VKNIRDEINHFLIPILNFSLSKNEVKQTVVPHILNETSRMLESIIKEIQATVQNNVENASGNCYVLPFVYDKAVWSLCHHGLPLINGTWISLGIICISMAGSIILTCRISGYIRGANVHSCPWRQQLEGQRYSSQTARRNGAILLDQLAKPTASTTTQTKI